MYDTNDTSSHLNDRLTVSQRTYVEQLYTEGLIALVMRLSQSRYDDDLHGFLSYMLCVVCLEHTDREFILGFLLNHVRNYKRYHNRRDMLSLHSIPQPIAPAVTFTNRDVERLQSLSSNTSRKAYDIKRLLRKRLKHESS